MIVFKRHNQAEDRVQQFAHLVHEFLIPPGRSDLVSFNRGAERPLIRMPIDLTRQSMPENELYGFLKQAKAMLEKTTITASFCDHLLDNLHQQADIEAARLPEPALLGECGIDLGKKEWGIFDPSKAKEIEAKAIRENNPNPFLDEGLARIHNMTMDRWIEEFQQKYQEDPLG